MVGDVHPYVERIALVKWLNREFGYSLTTDDLEGENPRFDEHKLDWHLAYSTTFSDPKVREAGKFHAKALRERGVFSATYEFGSEE